MCSSDPTSAMKIRSLVPAFAGKSRSAHRGCLHREGRKDLVSPFIEACLRGEGDGKGEEPPWGKRTERMKGPNG